MSVEQKEHIIRYLDELDFIGGLDNWSVYVSYTAKTTPIMATDGFGKVMKAKTVPEIEDKIEALRNK